MYLFACAILLAFATVLNLRDWRMLTLTLLVGVTIFLPVPSYSQLAFYGTCITAETVVMLVCVFLAPRAGCAVFYICLMMVVSHLMGFALGGHAPLSPYRAIMKLLEFSQLLACVALSPVLAPKLENRDATTA